MSSYWLKDGVIKGPEKALTDGEILIIGSGISGVSSAYWLHEQGFRDIYLVDHNSEDAATFRNCGHILHGTVESMQALVALHGNELARKIWDFSVQICDQVRETVERLDLDCEYKQDGYLCLAINQAEDEELKKSVKLLNSMNFDSEYLDATLISQLGFKEVFGGRYEKGSAQAHPGKFRNGLLKKCLENGLKYHSNQKVSGLHESGGRIEVITENGRHYYDAVVIAANAYSPLFSDFFASRKLVEPFRGQIIVSEPLDESIPVTYPHSFDHGYEYALRTMDNRLMIGGWRNHSETREVGSYDLTPNQKIETGLKNFVSKHYNFQKPIKWEYSWAGIMASSSTGFPLIGPTEVPNIFSCAGFTGHGFSWAHGSAKLLADIVAGNSIPEVAEHFRPAKI